MERRISKPTAVYITASIGAICLIVFLIYNNTNREIVEHANILRQFERAKAADHNLNENILRLRTFMLNTYDPLVREVAKLRKICKEMRELPEYSALREFSTKQSLEAYCTAVDAKAALIERYKTENSVLQNSIKFLPSIVTQFRNHQLSRQAHELLAAVLIFHLEPTDELSHDIKSQIRILSRAGGTERKTLESLNRHATVILTRSAARRSLERQILGADFLKDLKRLDSDYLGSYQSKRRRALFVYYFLILTCVGMGFWLTRMFFKLKAATESLSDMNLNLERKVEQRTRELSDAMKQLASNQQMMMQSTKMTALGEMAGGIAHEINTPLAAILINANILLEESNGIPQADFFKKRLDAIVKIVERVSKIITGLRKFARSSDNSEKGLVPISLIVDDTLVLCAEKLRAHSVEIRLKGMESGLMLTCVPEQISQVLLNFLSNALDALRELPIPENKRWICIAAEQVGEFLELSVTDAGGGLSPDVQAKIMQPFFTTKPIGVGTGLGLSISKGIVEDHGGKLIYDAKSPNTRFVMRFAMADHLASATSA